MVHLCLEVVIMAARKSGLRRFTLAGELQRLRRNSADEHDKFVLGWAVRTIKHTLAAREEQTDVLELERLFRLEDPRGAS
jgi:hypothetical protein